MKYAYKMYWKLKTSLLEKTLIDSLNSTDSTIDEQLFLNNIDDQAQENKSSNAINDCPFVDINKSTVWGEHLNNKLKPAKENIVKSSENSISVKFSKKLFDGCDFKKRNPRKSSKKKTGEFDCEQNVSDCISIITSNDSSTQEDSAFHDDSNLSTIVADSDISINNAVKMSNISSFIPQALNILPKLSTSFDTNPKMITVNRKLNEGWLERCNENNSKVTNFNTVLPTVKQTNEIESDTDIVYESDNETKDIPLYSSQRIKAQEINCDSENNVIQETNMGDDITLNLKKRSLKKRYNSDDDFEEYQPKISKIHDLDSIQISVKDSRKKTILESKVSNGKANENFVRLDMKRKIYSRGKRSVKTTTYKKKQWKNRKKELGQDITVTDRTSLFKCFKCGDIGHYSKYCLKSRC